MHELEPDRSDKMYSKNELPIFRTSICYYDDQYEDIVMKI